MAQCERKANSSQSLAKKRSKETCLSAIGANYAN